MRTSKAGTCPEGFTLLELLVVIFVVSLMLAVTFPSFTLQTDGKLKSEAGRIASILRYLNDNAISTKDAAVLKMMFKEKTIYYKGPDGERKETFTALNGVSLQSKGMVSDGELEVFFSPTGAGESFSVYLVDGRSHATVTFNALSGRVKISENETA